MKVLLLAGNGGFAIGPLCAEVAACLRDEGHDVTVASVEHFTRHNHVAQRALKRQRPDFVLGYNWSSVLATTEGADFFARLRIPNVAWLFDDPFDHYDERSRDPAFHARVAAEPNTRIYVWDAEHVRRMRAAGADARHLPPGYFAHAHGDLDVEATDESRCDVGLLGNLATTARQALVEALCEQPLRVHAHVGHVTTGVALSARAQAALRPTLRTDEARARFFRGASLYVELPSNTGRTGLNIKTLNAMALGAFVLAPDSPELREHFDHTQLATYAARADLIEQVHRYLADAGARDAIARHGRDAVRARHAMAHRVRTLLAEVTQWLRAQGRAPAPAAPRHHTVGAPTQHEIRSLIA